MAELLKNVYSPAFIDSVASQFQFAYPHFDKIAFVNTIFDEQWESRELKSRLTFIAQTLHQFLPSDFKKSTVILNKVAPFFSGYEAMFFPAFIELYGLDDVNDYQISIDSLELLTEYSSAEFAVRPFIIKYPEKMMAQMLIWAKSDNFHVRRLASEGCRPRLPWACALPSFKKDPAKILPILECLKDDEQDYVYRSVANNLNDICKDHPELVVDIAQQWLRGAPSKNRTWLVKHACRNLLKSAHPDILILFGFSPPKHITLTDLVVDEAVIMGKDLNFSFILSSSKKLGRCRLEFVICFMKKNGKQVDKVFKISESEIKTNSKKVNKKFSFKAISTRQYYSGAHQLSVIVNGVRLAEKNFTLLD